MSRWTAALLLAISAFALYGLTAGTLTGYEPETAAVAEGLVKAGQPRVLPGSLFAPAGSGQGLPGRGGRIYGRQGLTQPVLEVPFYWVGLKLDELASGGRRDSARAAMLRLYNPLMAALTVLAIFGLLCARGVSERRALAVAGLSAVATLIWPYSKIGLDTTLMAMVALTFWAAARAAARPTTARFAAVGIAAGLAINSKPYGVFLVLAAIPLVWRPFWDMPRGDRVRALGAVAAPVLVAVAVGGWYNWYRTGSATDFMNTYIAASVAAPFNAIGLYLSPGKGLLFYSPLVILGVIGLRDLWRSDRAMALLILLAVAANTVITAFSWSWTDETWGPRYLVPSAWLLVLPIAWWARGRTRMRWLAALAAVGVCVQVIAIFADYGVTIQAARALAAAPVYPREGLPPGTPDPYGDDGPRWIPEMSPLLFQGELTAAYLKEQVTGTGFTVSYRPYDGTSGHVDLSHPERLFSPLPDFWWTDRRESTVRLFAIPLGLLLLAASLAFGRRWRTIANSDAPAPDGRRTAEAPERSRPMAPSRQSP